MKSTTPIINLETHVISICIIMYVHYKMATGDYSWKSLLMFMDILYITLCACSNFILGHLVSSEPVEFQFCILSMRKIDKSLFSHENLIDNISQNKWQRLLKLSITWLSKFQLNHKTCCIIDGC